MGGPIVGRPITEGTSPMSFRPELHRRLSNIAFRVNVTMDHNQKGHDQMVMDGLEQLSKDLVALGLFMRRDRDTARALVHILDEAKTTLESQANLYKDNCRIFIHGDYSLEELSKYVLWTETEPALATERDN